MSANYRLAVAEPTAARPRRAGCGRLAFSLVVILAMVGLVTLAKPWIEIPGLINGSAHAIRSLDLQFLDGWETPPIWYGPYTNTFGNILLFVPVGAAFYALTRGTGRAVLLGLATSLSIEVIQYIFALGYSDVDDLLFNTIGAALGGIWFARCDHAARTRLLRRLTLIAGVVAALMLTALGYTLLRG
ncbi:VanZ family protein [Corynebacterium sp. HMSC04H06]|uniref:VanZ family protein n=1 Tax=Corynebacterium sp. HMSC04H06 TaxID=1581050 RepID=UPI0014399B2A|nr:VanZ family protein [Corynebacterium sp. HMSC04H06]